MRPFVFGDIGLPDPVLHRVAKSLKACRSLAEILDIEQDGSEDVGEFVQSEIKVWLAQRRLARAQQSLLNASASTREGK